MGMHGLGSGGEPFEGKDQQVSQCGRRQHANADRIALDLPAPVAGGTLFVDGSARSHRHPTAAAALRPGRHLNRPRGTRLAGRVLLSVGEGPNG